MKRCAWCGARISDGATACRQHVDLEAMYRRLFGRSTADDAARELRELERELRRAGDDA